MAKGPIFTTIIDTYYRPALLKVAVEALFRQTYGDLEIILINNGAIPESVEYLHQVADLDSRVKLIHFKENQYSLDDPLKMLDVCLNAGLNIATGDYVWYQSDDDIIADDYAEKMVDLFQQNPECTTAAGLSISIDIQGNVNDTGPRASNYRPRYMPGHLLALDVLRGGRTMFNAPGSILTIKRDVLIKFGGYHRIFEPSQFYGIVPFGVTGYDETALFFQRHHDGQLNRINADRGWVPLKFVESMLKDCEIQSRWNQFGSGVAKEVVSTVMNQTCDRAAGRLFRCLYSFNVFGSIRVVRMMWYKPYFWRRILPNALSWPRIRHVLIPRIRYALNIRSGVGNISSRIARLRGGTSR